jgi:hypothetical protein
MAEDGDGVGADLVGDVAAPRDAVGADDRGLDLAAGHQRAGHVVGDDLDGDAVALQLPRGQAGALQHGAGLVGEHADRGASGVGAADHAERGAPARGRQGAGVAVGEDRPGRQQRGAVRGEAQARVELGVDVGLGGERAMRGGSREARRAWRRARGTDSPRSGACGPGDRRRARRRRRTRRVVGEASRG